MDSLRRLIRHSEMGTKNVDLSWYKIFFCSTLPKCFTINEPSHKCEHSLKFLNVRLQFILFLYFIVLIDYQRERTSFHASFYFLHIYKTFAPYLCSQKWNHGVLCCQHLFIYIAA